MPLDGPALPFPKTGQLAQPETATRRKLRKRAGRAEWARLRRAKLSVCRVCRAKPPRLAGLDETQIRAFVAGLSDDEIDEVFASVSLHHVVQRGGRYGGADVADNLVPLCGHGSAGCHGLVENRDPDACAAVAASLTDDEYAHAIQKGGEGFLERRYGVAS